MIDKTLLGGLFALLCLCGVAFGDTTAPVPSGGGWATWGVVEWTLVIGSITGSIVAIITAWKSKGQSNENEKNLQSVAQATQTLTEANKMNPKTDDPTDAVQAKVNDIAGGSL